MRYIDDTVTRREALRRAAYVLGGALSATTVAGVLAGCDVGRDPAADAGGAARVSRTLSPEQDEMVLAIGEYIIPTTDTPGARAARVHEYIDAMLSDFYGAEERDRFLAGLERIDAYARRRYGAGFVELSREQQEELAAMFHAAAFPPSGQAQAAVSEEAVGGLSPEQEPSTPAGSDLGEMDPRDRGRNAFMATLKELVVVGYYTSAVGATEELAVNPMGVWRADIPYSEIGRSWA